jgi:hypothetical protein
MLFSSLTLQDISILLAVSALLLLVTAEVVRYDSGEKLPPNEVKKLRNVALALGVMFLGTVAITVITIILNL